MSLISFRRRRKFPVSGLRSYWPSLEALGACVTRDRRRRLVLTPALEQLETRLMPSGAPTITAPPSISVYENATFRFTGADAISVNDPSGTAEQLKLSVSHGNLTITTANGPVTGATINGTGPLATIDQVL